MFWPEAPVVVYCAFDEKKRLRLRISLLNSRDIKSIVPFCKATDTFSGGGHRADVAQGLIG